MYLDLNDGGFLKAEAFMHPFGIYKYAISSHTGRSQVLKLICPWDEGTGAKPLIRGQVIKVKNVIRRHIGALIISKR